jgi:hypothetical protein
MQATTAWRGYRTQGCFCPIRDGVPSAHNLLGPTLAPMPIGFLTDADRDRLNRFPPDIPPADLLAFLTLSDADLELVRAHGEVAMIPESRAGPHQVSSCSPS